MPTQKDFKRLVRERMRKTGESYTAARARLLQRRSSRPTRSPSTSASARRSRAGAATSPVAAAQRRPRAALATGSADDARVAGMSDAAVEAKTGRSWAGWVEVLDRHEASTWPHRQIARLVHEQYAVPGWWAQTVTVGYERIKGLREKGQRRGGSFEASRSRTFAVPVEQLYDAFTKPNVRARWIPGVTLTVRKATAARSIRISWPDGTSVEVWLTAKAPARAQAQVQHRKLPDQEAVGRMKAYWAERLQALRALLEA